MKNKVIAMAVYTIMATMGLMLLVNSCGGGGKSLSPSKSGDGYIKARVSFGGTPAGQRYLAARAAGIASETISVAVSIEGIYEETQEEFEPITGSAEIDPTTLIATIELLKVPVGLNHILTATAVFPEPYSESVTVKGVIEEVAAGTTQEASANFRTTAPTDAFISYGQDSDTPLNQVPYSVYSTFLGYADQLYGSGVPYCQITASQLLSFVPITTTTSMPVTSTTSSVALTTTTSSTPTSTTTSAASSSTTTSAASSTTTSSGSSSTTTSAASSTTTSSGSSTTTSSI